MGSLHLTTGPSSWDRDMQGLDTEEESENLAALGMHVTGAKGDDDEDEDDKKEEEVGVEKVIAAESVDVAEEEEKKDEPEELDELKELDRLAKVLKEDDEPALIVDEEE